MKTFASPLGIVLLIAALLSACQSGPTATDFSVSRLFGNGMVLQRGDSVRIWGKAEPGKTLEVAFGETQAVATASPLGKWQAILPPPAEGQPLTLTVSGKGRSVTFDDILAGEVWLASGQSNMEWPLQATAGYYADTIAAADFPQIRFLKVEWNAAASPVDTVSTEGWKVCSPERAGKFSAVAYFFAKRLHQHLDVPVGIVESNWGGTPAEAWTSAEKLQAELPEFDEQIAGLEAAIAQSDDAPDARRAWLEKANPKDEILNGEAAKQALFDGKTDGLPAMQLPGTWEQQGLPGYDGVVWFVKKFDLPEGFDLQQAKLGLAMVDDYDQTWLNGQLIGETMGYNLPRAYDVPADALRPTGNVLTVRVADWEGGGGIYGEASSLTLTDGQNSVSLAGEWAYRVAIPSKGTGRVQYPDRPQRMPTTLYNGMIAPLIPLSMRGAIWYQGENNANRGRTEQYATLFPAMIEDWRERWGEEFPFLFVQLANFRKRAVAPTESAWAELRESQAAALNLPATGMAVIIDIGEADDIHPKNKHDVGHRLFLQARKVVYGAPDLLAEGPTFSGMEVEGNTVRLSFANVGGGLVAKDGRLTAFEIGEKGGPLYFAQASIDGPTVVLSHPKVSKPHAVRYCWADNPAASLFNAEGLPAAPFRSRLADR